MAILPRLYMCVDQVLVYEDLVDDLEAQLPRIASFLGVACFLVD